MNALCGKKNAEVLVLNLTVQKITARLLNAIDTFSIYLVRNYFVGRISQSLPSNLRKPGAIHLCFATFTWQQLLFPLPEMPKIILFHFRV
jgi:hypothetical protein